MSGTIDPEAQTIDEMDKTTAEDRNALVGFCSRCEEWYKFTRGVNFERCPKHKIGFSTQVGFQIISQRSFGLVKKKKRRNK